MKSAEEESAAASPKAVSDQTTIEGTVREKSDASRTQA
jgi:sec-independent protein translocase protein TatA